MKYKNINEFLDQSRFRSNGWVTYGFLFAFVSILISVLLGIINFWLGLPFWIMAFIFGSSSLRTQVKYLGFNEEGK